MASNLIQEYKKGKKTRKKIIEAAMTVFAQHPYNAASIRMIGKAAGIEHPLISYYFPTKAKLFEEIISQICNGLNQANDEFLEAVKDMSMGGGLSSFI